MTILSHQPSRLRAFTLIEMLVVIAVISVLAGMLFPIGSRIKISASIKQTQAQMEQISSAIENYKVKRGHYPPSNPNDPTPEVTPPIIPARPPLLYELIGAELKGGSYQTDRGAAFTKEQLLAAFNVAGIVNSTLPGGNPDDVQKKQNFAQNLDQNSIATNSVAGAGGPFTVEVLASKVPGPSGTPNVWHYSVGRPGSHNPNSFDLWLDVVLGGKTNRICNWSTKPIKL